MAKRVRNTQEMWEEAEELFPAESDDSTEAEESRPSYRFLLIAGILALVAAGIVFLVGTLAKADVPADETDRNAAAGSRLDPEMPPCPDNACEAPSAEAKASEQAIKEGARPSSESTAPMGLVGPVMPEQDDARISVQYLPLAPGQTAKLECVLTGDAQGTPVFRSSDETVVSAAEDGTITAVSEGAARVQMQVGDFTDSAAVWVTKSSPVPALQQWGASRYENRNGILRNPAADTTGQATILLTGDIMALASQQRAAKTGNIYNYNSSFDLVKEIFAQSDFVIGNLETCLSYSNPYSAQEKTVQGNPNCNAQATFLDALRHAGYDAVVTANNHCGDAGPVGVHETIQMLDEYEIGHTGTFSSPEEPRFLLADINGIRVAVLGYTEIINTKTGKLGVPEEDLPILFNRYSKERAEADIAAARDAGAEFVVAYTHWGTENTHAVMDLQKEHAQELADAGADFIAGSHSHCLQPPAVIEASDGRAVPCIYSMGNFVSSMGQDINNDTVILRIHLRRDGDKIRIDELGYIPCRVFSDFEEAHYAVVPIPQGLNGGKSSGALSAANRRIAAVMGDEVFHRLDAMPGAE